MDKVLAGCVMDDLIVSRQTLISTQLLAHYDSHKEIILTVDASTTGVGRLYLTNLLTGTDQLHVHPEH